MNVNHEWLAAFCRREKNSLHYRENPVNEFHRAYKTAIDGVIARLAHELQHDAAAQREPFDVAEFLAAVAYRGIQQ